MCDDGLFLRATLEDPSNGYTRFTLVPASCTHAIALYQKKIGEKYFVNLYEYHLSELGVRFEGRVQFCRGDETFNIELLSVRSIEQAERFFINAFDCLGAEPCAF